jgi:hypothetical protein
VAPTTSKEIHTGMAPRGRLWLPISRSSQAPAESPLSVLLVTSGNQLPPHAGASAQVRKTRTAGVEGSVAAILASA